MIFLRIILIFLTFSPESLFSKQGSGIVLVYHRFDEQKHPSTSISSQNFNEQLQYLKKNNYKGWLVVEAEQDPKKANPLEYAIKGYKYITDTLKKSNLEINNL